MSKRKIIEIDRDLCNGCGLCTTACAEGALELDGESKAVLVKEIYCDGLGACLDVCPTGALKIIERDSADYDAKSAHAHVLKTRGKEAAARVHGIGKDEGRRHLTETSACGCPGSAARELKPAGEKHGRKVSSASTLSQWPIQLHLVSPMAPYFKECDLLVAADCTAFALGSFHADLLEGKKLVIACPKLDDTEGYIEKLAELIRTNDLKSLSVTIMSVPCCSGLSRIVEAAVEESGVDIPVNTIVVGIDGHSYRLKNFNQTLKGAQQE